MELLHCSKFDLSAIFPHTLIIDWQCDSENQLLEVTLPMNRNNVATASQGLLGRDRFDSTASAGRRIPSASPIDLPEPIPEDPLPSSTPLRGRR